jgi:N-acetylmuramoyl-L-alanine amidase
MYKFVGFIFAAAFFGVAAAARPAGGGDLSSLNWVNTNANRNPFGTIPVNPIPPVIHSNPPANTEEWEPLVAPKIAPAAPTTKWVSLDTWAAQYGLGRPRLLSNLPVTTYSVRSPNGVMILEIGSRDATWNGIEIHLGFEPQMIDGQIYLQGRDLQKNLAPLLCDPPLALPPADPVIVIDPGHGGRNTGTHSVLDGRFEKEFTLDWAKRLAPLLAREGWQVLLTRTNDTYVTNADRVVFANKHHADFYISLHFNSLAPDEKPAGIETYCLTPTGMPSTLTRGYADPWSENFPNNAFDVQNLQLAVRLQRGLLHATGMEDRGVCRARFIGVLRGQHCPAVLIEAGFLSNPGDARQIETPAFREKLAHAVADALRLKPGIGNQNVQALTRESLTNKLSWP